MSTNSHLRLFTSESVTEGHPDKICDQISDAILDGIIAQDPVANVAVETLVTTGQVHVAGEVTTSSYVEIPAIVRETILGIGYDSSTRGFDGEFCGVSVSIGEQSPDINAGVYESLEARTGVAVMTGRAREIRASCLGMHRTRRTCSCPPRCGWRIGSLRS